MYKSFQIKANDCENLVAKSQSRTIGYIESLTATIDRPREVKKILQESLKNFEINNDCIEAEKIWDSWFPALKSDVFISHSSRDEKAAGNLSNFLKNNLGLTSFIDSEIWSHKDDLQKSLDDAHCYNSTSKTYNYECRNQTTTHVNRLLSHALTRMIDQTECFIFIESDNSTVANTNRIAQKTLSPWIFHELSTAETIKKQSLERSYQFSKASSQQDVITEVRDLNVTYPVPNTSLTHINDKTLNLLASKKRGEEALDLLYSISD